MNEESIDVFVDKPNANELEEILALGKLDYDLLNQILEYNIVEYDSLLESHSILFSDQSVMTIVVFVDEDKAHIKYWLTTPAGDEIDGNRIDKYVSTYRIRFNGKHYVVRLISCE